MFTVPFFITTKFHKAEISKKYLKMKMIRFCAENRCVTLEIGVLSYHNVKKSILEIMWDFVLCMTKIT